MYGVLFLCFALQTTSAEGAQHMQAGVEAHRQKNFNMAIAEFQKATQTDPNLPDAFLDLGDEYMQIRNYGEAIVAFKRVLELRPDLDEAHLQLGYALLSQGFAAEAIPHLERVHAIEALSIAQVETGQYEQAIGNLNAALQRRPNDPDLLYYLGRASGLLSKRSIDTLVEAYPDSARAHQAMAENYLVLRQLPQAENEYHAALQQRPDVPGLHLELGIVYAAGAQWDKAEEEFRTEVKLRPGEAEASYRLGAALLQEGKVQEARKALDRADQLKPGMPETLYSLGKAASLQGDTAAAEKAWLQLLQIEKESSLAAQAHFGLAALYRKQGNTAKAETEMQDFKRLQKSSPQSGDKPNY
jgi:tetratricopeptide (TPR) repeat protein